MKCVHCTGGWLPPLRPDGWAHPCAICQGSGDMLAHVANVVGLSKKILRRIDAGAWRGGRGHRGTLYTVAVLVCHREGA